MNSARYEELLGRMLEGDLSDREAEEFAAELRANPARLRDLRRHLVLWEIWSQHQAPERSSEAFVNAWKTRLRAETEGADVFPDAVRAQIEARQPPPGVIEFFRWFIAARRPVRMAWAASLLIASLALVVWFAAPRSAHAVISIKGEAVCTACVLHESHEHTPAVRVIANSSTNVYYLVRNSAVAGLQDYFCSGPRPVTAEGKARMEAGRRRFEAEHVTIRDADKTRENRRTP
jgi:hypothetical protein